MKTVVCGSRTITNPDLVAQAITESGFSITEIVSGHASGVDTLAERYARLNNIPLNVFPANWLRYGKSAGPKRNQEMADYAECVIAIWDGKSRGTKDMIEKAKSKGLQIYILRVSSLEAYIKR